MAGSLGGGPVTDGAATPAEQRESFIRALLWEREGYIAAGNAEGVAAVEAELVRYGYELVERATALSPVLPETATVKRRSR